MKKNLVFLLAALFFAALAWGQSITVIAPNGGESWPRGEIRDIAWTAPGCSGNVRINLIPAGGGAVQTVAVVPVTDGRYPWAVGETNSGTAAAGDYLIGLYVHQQDVDDRSDATFAITGGTPPPALRVTSPNGGENWGIGSIRAITWDPGGLSGDAQIILYKENGARFDRLATVPVAGGSYSWIVGETEVLKRTNSGYAPAGSYRIEIKANAASDRSDAPFAIQESSLPEILIAEWHYKKKLGFTWLEKKKPELGDEIKFVALVRNGGPAPTGSGFRCSIHVKGPEGFTPREEEFLVPSLPVNGTHEISIIFKCTHEGAITVKVALDEGNDVIEADETNNTTVFRHIILPLPDLTLVNVSWFHNANIGSTEKVWGEVKNIGKGRSPQVQMYIKCSPKVKTRTKTIRSLNPGETERFEFGFEYWTTGTKRGFIVVDSDHKATESREDNNRVEFSFKVITSTIFD